MLGLIVLVLFLFVGGVIVWDCTADRGDDQSSSEK